jgi:hypothetical protein
MWKLATGLLAALALVGMQVAVDIGSGPPVAASSPRLASSVSSLNFGNVGLGSYAGVKPGTTSGAGYFLLTNDDVSADTIDLSSGVSFTGSGANDYVIVATRTGAQACPGSGSQIVLAASAQCGLEVSFHPGALGDRSANMTITGTDSTSVMVPLTGTGVPTLGAFSSSFNSQGVLDFGGTLLGTFTGPEGVDIQLNQGLASDTINLTSGVSFTGPGADDYAVTPSAECAGDGLNTVVLQPSYLDYGLPGPSDCTLNVSFFPGALGDRSATMTIQGSIGTSVAVGLSGSGSIGYYEVDSLGDVANFGDAAYFGDAGGAPLNKPIVGMAVTGDGGGYWLVASDGGIFSFGDAQFFGSAGSIALNKPIVGMTATPDAGGYWFVASDGGIFSYGDAPFYGSTGSIALNKPIVGMTATPDGGGYWLVASDGGIFSFGDASFYGSTGSIALNKPIVGMAATPDGGGYWLVASDGGIFSYGDAHFYGSTGAIHLDQPIVGMASMPTGNGYWFSAADGGLFNYGDAPFYGSAVGQGLGQVVGIATDGSPTVQEQLGIPAIRQAHASGRGGAMSHAQHFAGS